VQSHERIVCVTSTARRTECTRNGCTTAARILGPLARAGLRLNPYHRYVLAAEQRLFASPRLRAVICNFAQWSEMKSALISARRMRSSCHLQRIDLEAFHPRLREVHRSTMRQKLGIPQHVPVHLHVGAGSKGRACFGLTERRPLRAA